MQALSGGTAGRRHCGAEADDRRLAGKQRQMLKILVQCTPAHHRCSLQSSCAMWCISIWLLTSRPVAAKKFVPLHHRAMQICLPLRLCALLKWAVVLKQLAADSSWGRKDSLSLVANLLQISCRNPWATGGRHAYHLSTNLDENFTELRRPLWLCAGPAEVPTRQRPHEQLSGRGALPGCLTGPAAAAPAG